MTSSNTSPSSQDFDALPRHVAIIMDGNGRWARAQDKPRSFGHVCGAKRVRPIIEETSRLGIEALTLYSFSTENWARSSEEVETLMSLYVQYLIAEREEMVANNVRLYHLGRREGLPQKVLDQLDQSLEATAKCTGLKLCAAINYGSRAEITDAVRAIARQVQQGDITADAIDEAMIDNHLDTAGIPDPDLVIRTAGEHRISNYLLWQISYSEIYVAQKCWPDFDLGEYHAALRSFSGRKRNYGAVPIA